MNLALEAGRIFYAVGIIAFGVQHIAYGAFVTRVVPKLPAAVPAQSALAYLIGAILIVCGAAIALRIRMRGAALTLAALLALSVATLYLPSLAMNPYQGGFITNTFKAIALCGGALVILQMTNGRTARRSAPLGRVLFASFLIVAGVQHFLYTQFVATLVPAWIPPRQSFWTYIAGVALIAGGVGIIFPLTTRVAATLVGIMILLWVPLLHIPRALTDLHNSNETTAVFEALAMSGIAFMIAGLLRNDFAAH
jgi:uncharacterized membrane protein